MTETNEARARARAPHIIHLLKKIRNGPHGRQPPHTVVANSGIETGNRDAAKIAAKPAVKPPRRPSKPSALVDLAALDHVAPVMGRPHHGVIQRDLAPLIAQSHEVLGQGAFGKVHGVSVKGSHPLCIKVMGDQTKR